MSCIVKEKRKGTSTVYAYESTSYWVPGKGPRCKRKLIGKIDPVSGEIVPTGKRGRPPKTSTPPNATSTASAASAAGGTASTEVALKQQLIDAIASKQEQDGKILELADEMRTLRTENQKLQVKINRMERSIRETRSIVLESLDACLDAFQSEDG